MFANWSLEDYKTLLELGFYAVAILSAFAAVYTYWRNSSLDRVRWVSSLYEKFYEGKALKRVRGILDNPPGTEEVTRLVIECDSEFTDYLNFFEYLAYLKETRQVRRQDVDVVFGYYLECLKRHGDVWRYIVNPENGYEKLRDFLEHR